MKLMILAVLATALTSCGESFHEEEDILPPSGPRYFEGNDREFFGSDSPIVTIRPELGYRPDLQLKDDVYWVPDDVAERRTVLDASTMKVELSGLSDDVALRYEPGMVVIHKYYPMRHRILAVEKKDDHVLWTVVAADYQDVIENGDIYVKKPAGVPTPVGFDVLDPWLYESRTQQLEIIREKYLDSELIGMMATEESLREVKKLKERLDEAEGMTTTRQSQTAEYPLPPPGFCRGFVEDNLSCDALYPAGSDEYEGCLDRRDPCDGLYDDSEAGRSALAECEAAAAAGDFALPQLAVCDAYIRNNIDSVRATGDPNGDPLNWNHQACLARGLKLTNCAYGLYADSGRCAPSFSTAYTPEYDEEGNRIPLELCPVYRPDLSLDASIELVCETICQFEEDRRDASGGASADNWGAGIGICINSKAFGDDKCRAGTAISAQPGGFKFSGGIDVTESTQLELPVELTLTPVFTSAVGFSADIKISAFWAGVKIGFFAGVGIGNKTELEFPEAGARLTKKIDILKELELDGQLEIPLPPILFLTFFIRPVLEVEFFAEASVKGKVVHEYFQEKSFAICLTAKLGAGPGYGDWPGTKLRTGQDAADSCGLPFRDAEDNLNDLRVEDSPGGVEVRAGLEVLLGVELVLKVAGSVELGSLAFFPFVARFSIGATYRPPRCTLEINIAFGWRVSGSLTVGISRFMIELYRGDISGTYDKPRYYETFPLPLPGCGEVEAPEPAEYEGVACPPGPDPADPDGNCAALPDFAGTSASCFVDRCVTQDALRASLAWFDPTQDLDLYLRDPEGVTYTSEDLFTTSCGATCGDSCSDDSQCLDGWICEADQCVPSDPTYIENFTTPTATPGEWQAWVVRPETRSDQPVLFDLEFETRDGEGKRQATRGSLEPTDDGSVYEFVFCVGEACR